MRCSSLLILALLPLQLAACGAAKAQELPLHIPDSSQTRSEIPTLYQWDLSPLFANDEAWEAQRAALEDEIPTLTSYAGKLSEPASLNACLDLYFRLHNDVNHLGTYAKMRLDTARQDPLAIARHQKSLSLLDQLTQSAAFIRAEILGLDAGALDTAYAQMAALEVYRGYIENLRRRQSRLLDPAAERVLSLMGDNLWAEIDLNEIPSPAEDVFSALLGELPWPSIIGEDGQPVQLSLSNYGRFRQSPSREVRKAAVEGLMGTLRSYQNSLAASLAAQAKLDVSYAKARGYDTAVEAYLDKDAISVEVYENLIRTVNGKLQPLHRYVTLRKKLLGYDSLHLYDLYVPLVASVDNKVDFPTAAKYIKAALEPLGPEYGQVLATALDPKNGWMELYPHQGKDSGAYSVSVYGRHPYLLMNYQDSMDDMSTLAHELGHALHSYLSMNNQSYPDFRYAAFIAEIASTANEALLNDYLVESSEDKALKAALLVERLETIRSTIYRQTLFAEFELAVHAFIEEGTPITAELLDKTYAELVKRYYGPDFELGPDDGMEWAYVPHFYWKYYVFTYATGLSAGIAVSKLVRQGEAERNAYLNMLGSGSLLPPLDLLRNAGVDLSKPDPILAALEDFDATLSKLEALLQ
ncbi:MAG: oligoendopeptidase F [Myxococcota bacterium]|jgi:oligoendopeptidase F|nr:oligoendopeptidase F [Myxococcota bacterium]